MVRKLIAAEIVIVLMAFSFKVLPLYAYSDNKYTVCIEMGSGSIDFSKLTGFEFSLTGKNIKELENPMIGRYSKSFTSGELFNGSTIDSLEQENSWEIYKTTSSNGVAGYLKDFNDASSSANGFLIVLEGSSSFSINNLLLASCYYPDGHYPASFQLDLENLENGKLYTCTTTPIPLPQSFILLLIGLVSLFVFHYGHQKEWI